MKYRFTLLLFFVVSFIQLCASTFYVSPVGSAHGSGTFADPWNLQTALNHPAMVLPGDTILIREGRYFGKSEITEIAAFVSVLTGTREKPIIVMPFPGERVILDGANRKHPVDDPPASDSYILGIIGSFTWYIGMEVTDSNPFSRADSLSGFRWRPSSIISSGTGIRLINLMIYDTGSGLGPFSGCIECELYGNIIFYNGWSHLGVRGHGEGVYGQNREPVKYLLDNIVFKQFDSGIILYGTTNATIDNFHIEGNVIFQNGVINDNPNGWGFLFGKNSVASGPGKNFIIQDNYLYNRFDYLRSNNIDLGYQSGLKDVILKNNYSVGRWAMRNNLPVEGLHAYGNTFVGELYPVTAAQVSVDSNELFSPSMLPQKNQVFVRPNNYEQGRAHIICYNWEGKPEIEVNLSKAGLKNSESFEVFDVQNIFGPKVYAGKYNESDPVIFLPSNLKEVTKVTGLNVPRQAIHSDSVFNVFILKSAKEIVKLTETGFSVFDFNYKIKSGNLIITTRYSSNWRLELVDIQGRSVDWKDFTGSDFILPLTEEIKGLYFVKLSDVKNVQTKVITIP